MKHLVGEKSQVAGEQRRILRFPGPVEERLFQIGCVLFVVEALAVVALFFVRPQLFEQIIAVLVGIAIGGRALSVPAGLAVGLPPASLIIILVLFNCTWILLFYSVLVSAYSNLVESEFLKKLARPATRLAENRRERMQRWPSVGLLFFIWLPFPWTGAAVGSMIGFLLGMSSKRVMAIVLPAMVFSVVTWTLGFDYLFVFQGTAGKLIVLAFVLVVLLVAVYRRFSDSEESP